MSRQRQQQQTAVEITAHVDIDEAMWRETGVWVVENYSPDRMWRVIASNPSLFPPDLSFTFRVIMTWHSRRRFLKWAIGRPSRSLRGWMGGMRLA